jgi:Putative lumazine-binding
MPTFNHRVLTLGLFLMTTFAIAQSNPSERQAAEVPLQNYVRAHETGNPELIRQAFTKDAKVIGYMGGKLISWSTEEYAARFSGKPAEDESKRVRDVKLLSIAGDAAVGKVTLDYPTVKFVDFMSLLKIEGQWKIVNKSFNAEAKAAQ